MDRKSKILLYIFFFFFVGTVMFSYARYMIFHDFEVMRSEEETFSEEPSMDDASSETGNPEENEQTETSEGMPSL